MNDPLMYIDTISYVKEGTSNQDFYDTRVGKKKSKASYRLEDIKAMLYYRIHILAEIIADGIHYEGIVESCNEDGILIKTNEHEMKIPLSSVEHINILKL